MQRLVDAERDKLVNDQNNVKRLTNNDMNYRASECRDKSCLSYAECSR